MKAGDKPAKKAKKIIANDVKPIKTKQNRGQTLDAIIEGLPKDAPDAADSVLVVECAGATFRDLLTPNPDLLKAGLG